MANADEGDDWRAGVGLKSSSDDLIDLERARQPARGREAETPEQIPALGWRDIMWRVVWSISAIGAAL